MWQNLSSNVELHHLMCLCTCVHAVECSKFVRWLGCQIIENAPYVEIGWQFAFQPTDLCNCEVKTHCLQIQMSKVKHTLVYFDKLGYWIEGIVRLFNLSSVKRVVLWIDSRCFILAVDLKRGKHQIWHKYSLLENVTRYDFRAAFSSRWSFSVDRSHIMWAKCIEFQYWKEI